MTITCKHCKRRIELAEGRWVDPEATGDDSVWRETCDANHEDRIAAHEPGDDPLDVWLMFDEPDDEEASHEANTFYDEGNYRVDWSHTAVGQVTSQTFGTYAEATAWLEAGGYQDFTP